VSAQFAGATDRLRPTLSERPQRVRQIDAEVWVPPKFWVLLLLALAAIVAQSTLLHSLSLRGARPSLVTILVTWAGLRCGVATGGILGLIAGLVEDGLGGAGTDVLGTTLAGFAAGSLKARFFADSLPVFACAVGAATVIRGAVTYAVMEIGLGERGMFHTFSHALAWQVVLNVVLAGAILLLLRALERIGR
jgi:rod shape-determining protein MreD